MGSSSVGGGEVVALHDDFGKTWATRLKIFLCAIWLSGHNFVTGLVLFRKRDWTCRNISSTRGSRSIGTFEMNNLHGRISALSENLFRVSAAYVIACIHGRVGRKRMKQSERLGENA